MWYPCICSYTCWSCTQYTPFCGDSEVPHDASLTILQLSALTGISLYNEIHGIYAASNYLYHYQAVKGSVQW